jgi:hypothetical protein
VKKSLIYLIALMLLTTIAFAGDAATKKTDSKACAKDSTCAMKCAEKGMDAKTCAKMCADKAAAGKDAGDKKTDAHAGCPYMGKASDKAEATTDGATVSAASSDGKPAAECPMHAGKTAAKAEAPSVTVESATSIKETVAPTATVTSTSAAAEKISVKIPEGSCPDVSGKNELMNFHETMSPMHMAYEKNDYAEIKNRMPKMMEAAKKLVDYKCPTEAKCTPECLKSFEGKKDVLLRAVEGLEVACQGDDNQKIGAAFESVHSSFVDFGSFCSQKAKTTDTKSETK